MTKISAVHTRERQAAGIGQALRKRGEIGRIGGRPATNQPDRVA